MALLVLLLVAALLARAGHASDWNTGRVTWYDDTIEAMSVNAGSCGFGTIDTARFPQWAVAGISDQHPQYPGSCGRCVEIRCLSESLTDSYGETLSRHGACKTTEGTVVVVITDTCPCVYPGNAYSNKRWCCGDASHFDLSVWAFERLADPGVGVIPVQYRFVDCSVGGETAGAAPLLDNPTPRRGEGGGGGGGGQ